MIESLLIGIEYDLDDYISILKTDPDNGVPVTESIDRMESAFRRYLDTLLADNIISREQYGRTALYLNQNDSIFNLARRKIS